MLELDSMMCLQARNNRLELQTRNNGKLLNCLDNLLSKLQLPVHIERALKNPLFTQQRYHISYLQSMV